jgi:GAF domain-containing protein
VKGFYSDTAIPALQLAVLDHTRVSRAEHRHRVASGMAQLIADLRDDHRPPRGRAAPAGRPRLLCVGARWELDTLAADMLDHALALDGIASRVLPATAVSADHIQSLDLAGVDLLCLSIFSDTPQAQVRYISRRLKRRAPTLRIVAALWHHGGVTEPPPDAAALCVDAVACSLAEATARLAVLLDSDPDGNSAASTPPQSASSLAVHAARLAALADSGALDPAMRAPLDRAAQRTAEVFGTALAMVSLLNDSSQIWQGAAGLDRHLDGAQRSTPLAQALCANVVAAGQVVVVEDMSRDPRFSAHPLAAGAALRFYAGAPLRTAGGQTIGSLCLLDHAPRVLSPAEQQLLVAMADEVMDLIQAHGLDRRTIAAAPSADAAGWAASLPPTPA